MLDISIPELMCRGTEQVLAHKAWLGVDKGHRVLQLVAKPEGSTRLVESTSRPEAARESLVQKPAVGQDLRDWSGVST